jgi:beta-galactosidase
VKYALLLYFFSFTGVLHAQTDEPATRTIVSLNEAWLFTKGIYSIADVSADKQVNWQPVHLPHTWNATVVMDDEPGYYRGVAWYKKKLAVNASWRSKKIFLFFEGANQEADIYVNGKKAGHHIGGYTAFYVPVTKSLQFDGKENLNDGRKLPAYSTLSAGSCYTTGL